MIYKVFGLLLLASPITFSNSVLFFPYSYLGFTLLFLSTVLLDTGTFVKLIETVLWGFATLSILSYKPLSYSFIIMIFLLCQFFELLVLKKNHTFDFFIWIGILGTLGILFLPVSIYVCIVLLIILHIIKYNSKANDQSQQICIQSPSSSPDLELLISDSDSNKQEQDYVIPMQDSE